MKTNNEVSEQLEATQNQLAELRQELYAVQEQLTNLQTQINVIKSSRPVIRLEWMIGLRNVGSRALRYVRSRAFIILAPPLRRGMFVWRLRKQIPSEMLKAVWAGLYWLLFAWIILKGRLAGTVRGD